MLQPAPLSRRLHLRADEGGDGRTPRGAIVGNPVRILDISIDKVGLKQLEGVTDRVRVAVADFGQGDGGQGCEVMGQWRGAVLV